MKKLLKNLFLMLCLMAVAAFTAITLLGYRMYREAVQAQPLPERVAQVQQNPDYAALSELPKTYTNAVIAVEDHRFLRHGGVDIVALGRAVCNDLIALRLKEGGSTITQQLAKNLYFTQEKSFIRKVAELFVAFDLEHNYSKQEILELYVNSIYFGNGYYCVRSASLGYFGKEPAAMSDFECTLLAGIPNAPSVYAPTENPALALQRQQAVLEAMVEYGYLTQAESAAIAAMA